MFFLLSFFAIYFTVISQNIPVNKDNIRIEIQQSIDHCEDLLEMRKLRSLDSAKVILDSTLKIANQHLVSPDSLLGKLYNSTSWYYHANSNYSKCEEYAFKAIKIFETSDESAPPQIKAV